MSSTPSLAIIKALDDLVRDVRKNHRDVPENIVIALASGRSKRSAVHGHFAPESWKDNHEILIAGESLQRGPEATLGTLIHELAHATAHATGVRDTSNNGRYHNKRFKEIAEGMGIELEQAPTIGWSVTTLPDSTAAKYAKGLGSLKEALKTWRLGAPVAEVKPKGPANKTKMKINCECGEDNAVTVSIKWFEANDGVVSCAACGSFYMPWEA